MDPLLESVRDQVQFTWPAWLIIAAYMIFTTWLGHRLSGRQATIRDFFLGGRRLPWYAVCGSIIATELSAMTLVVAPAFLWSATGDMSYAVLGVGTILARIVVGYWFVPHYYSEEIYSPYEYIGNRLGERAGRTTSLLFMLGGVLGQGTRVLLTAVVLQVVTGISIFWSIWIVGLVAVLWTWMGGITTVIWTDVIQFGVFLFSSLLMMLIVLWEFPPTGVVSPGLVFNLAWEEGKFHWLNFEFDLTQSYTVWAGLIASTIGGLAAYGTDQMLVQRLFCCRDPREARKAIIWSSAGQIMMVICLLTGVGLWAYYQRSGLPDTPNAWEATQIAENTNRLVPVFIKFRMPWYLGGIMVAGIFAAAISSLDSILAALAQQTLAWTRGRRGEQQGDAREIALSRLYVILWAIVLCGMATVFQMLIVRELSSAEASGTFGSGLLIELALAVVGYTSGGILGFFLLALVPSWRVEGRGLEWAAALSVMTIFAITQHAGWAFTALLAAGAALIAAALGLLPERRAAFTLKLLPFIAGILLLNRVQTDGLRFAWPYGAGGGGEAAAFIRLGWPWFVPLGCLVMVTAAWTLCRRQGGRGAEEPVRG
ncbi:MAG TPA: hypothetical protein PLG73_08145 [Candidatus Sumerlaeota bacterium]|nr:hypothetical protein [Candidatus Sumerlaeota bacterium]